MFCKSRNICEFFLNFLVFGSFYEFINLRDCQMKISHFWYGLHISLFRVLREQFIIPPCDLSFNLTSVL